MSHNIHYVKLDECAGRLKSLSSQAMVAAGDVWALYGAMSGSGVVFRRNGAAAARHYESWLPANGACRFDTSGDRSLAPAQVLGRLAPDLSFPHAEYRLLAGRE